MKNLKWKMENAFSCRLPSAVLPSAVLPSAVCRLPSAPQLHFPAFCNFLILRFTSSRLRGLILSRKTMPSQ